MNRQCTCSDRVHSQCKIDTEKQATAAIKMINQTLNKTIKEKNTGLR